MMGGLAPKSESEPVWHLGADPWEIAIGLVGMVVLYHNLPRWCIPPVRPFTCPMCLACLLGLFLWGIWDYRDLDLLVAAFMAGGLAGIVSTFAPWLFYRTDA